MGHSWLLTFSGWIKKCHEYFLALPARDCRSVHLKFTVFGRCTINIVNPDYSVIMKIYRSLSPLFAFSVISITASLVLPKPGKIIIDTDAGGDDAAAILLAIAAEEKLQGSGFEIIAITCVYGNTKVTNVELNVQKILTIAGRTDIPVYVGAKKPLMQNYTMTNYFGRDGMDDIDFPEKIIARTDRSKHASVALVDLARRFAGNVSVLALGPVTNLGIAMSLDPDFVHNVERFYIMGSCPYGRGSIAPNVDFNFYQDPESNFILLNSTTSPPAVLLPSGVSRWAAIPSNWRTETIGTIDSKRMRFLNQVERRTYGGSKWKNADLTLTALALWPDLLTKTLVTNLTPVFEGAARGTVLVDYRNTTGKQINAILLEEFDVPKFQQRLLETFT